MMTSSTTKRIVMIAVAFHMLLGTYYFLFDARRTTSELYFGQSAETLIEPPSSDGIKSTKFKKVSDVKWVKRLNGRRYQVQRIEDMEVKTNTIPNITIIIDHKLLWCPLPKAGSTSIYESILFPLRLLKKGWKHHKCRKDCPILASRILEGNDVIEQDFVMRAPSFTVVRNPWDRIRSCYLNKIVGRRQFIPTNDCPDGAKREKCRNKKGIEDDNTTMSFTEFVDHVEKYPLANRHWAPHSILCLASDGGFHYDHILKIEDGLFEQLQDVFGAYGLPFEENAEAKNVIRKTKNQSAASKDDYLRQFYEDATVGMEVSVADLVEKVRNIYEYDVKAYGYTFPW